MSPRKSHELYEILNKHNVVDRWKPGEGGSGASAPLKVGAASIQAWADPACAPVENPAPAAQSIREVAASAPVESVAEASMMAVSVANDIQNSLNHDAAPEMEVADSGPAVAVIEDPACQAAERVQQAPVEQSTIAEPPVEQAPASKSSNTAVIKPAVPSAETPYTFKFKPRGVDESNAASFGDRRIALSYDMAILGAIVVTVLIIASFILGAKFGKGGKPAPVVAGSNESPAPTPVPPAGSNSGNLMAAGTSATLPGTADAAAQNPSSTTQNPMAGVVNPETGATLPNPLTTTPMAGAGDGVQPPYYSVLVIQPKLSNPQIKKDVEEFSDYLKTQGFSDVWTRMKGDRMQLFIGRSREKIAVDADLVKRVRDVKFKAKSRSSFTPDDALPILIKE